MARQLCDLSGASPVPRTGARDRDPGRKGLRHSLSQRLVREASAASPSLRDSPMSLPPAESDQRERAASGRRFGRTAQRLVPDSKRKLVKLLEHPSFPRRCYCESFWRPSSSIADARFAAALLPESDAKANAIKRRAWNGKPIAMQCSKNCCAPSQTRRVAVGISIGKTSACPKDGCNHRRRDHQADQCHPGRSVQGRHNKEG